MSRNMVWKLLYFGKEPPFPCELGTDTDPQGTTDKRGEQIHPLKQMETKGVKSARLS